MRRPGVLLALLLALLAPALAWGAIAEVGAGSQRATTVATADEASRSLAYPANVAQNSLLVTAGVCRNLAGAPASITVTDTRSTSYTVVSAAGLTNHREFIAYGIAPTAGADTVTVDPAGSARCSFSIDEFSGVDTTTPLDVDGLESTGTSTTPSDALTTGTANALLVGVLTNAQNGVTITPGTGYTQIGESETPVEFSTEFQIVTTAQSYTVDWTMGSNVSWAVYTAGFRESGGGGGASVGVRTGPLLRHGGAKP